MAVNIGPKIGLDGEKEYRDALKNITAQTKTLKAEMKATASEFSTNSKGLKGLKDNMSQAQAKAKNLNEQIKLQKERLQQANEMLAKASAQYGDTDAKTLKFRQEVANATTELNRLQTELSNIPSKAQLVGQAFEETGAKLKGVSDKMAAVGDAMTKHLTVPIMAFATAAVGAFKSLDTGYDTIIKKTGLTGDAYEDLKEQANDIYTSMNVSMDDVGAAIGEVNTRFGLAGDAAETTARAFLEFAQVNGGDVSSSVDTVQNALAAYSMDVGDASAVLDVLTATGQRTGASTDKLASTVVENATAFQQMGLDIYQSIDFMGQFETAGADSNAVLSGMKRALKSATDSGIPFDQALADLEDTIINGTDDMDGLSAAYDLFGKSGAAVYQAVKNGQISFTDFADTTDILNESLGATSDTYEATLDPIDEFKIALNKSKVALAQVGSTILKLLTPAIEKISGIITKLSTWWSGLSEKSQKTILTILGITAAIGPLISIGSKLVGGISSVFSGVGKVITFLPKLTALLSPTTLIIGLVVAAIAAVVVVIKNWGAITDWISEKWATFTGWLSGIWETIKTTAATAWEGFKNTILGVWEGIKTVASTVWEFIKAIIITKIQIVVTVVTALWSGLKTVATTVWNGIKTVVTTVTSAISTWVTTKWTSIKTATSTAWTSIKTAVSTAWTNMKSAATTGATAMFNTISSKFTSIKTKISTIMTSAKTAVSNAITAIKNLFNFSWSLPSLKLPHFSITGGFSLHPLSMPKISVSWYKKAYDNPVMFRSPTVLATTSGLKGFGDGSGGEIVIGQSMMYDLIRSAVQDGNGGGNTYTVVVNAAPGMDEEQIGTIAARKIYEMTMGKRAVYA